jgi:hypothetical protein
MSLFPHPCSSGTDDPPPSRNRMIEQAISGLLVGLVLLVLTLWASGVIPPDTQAQGASPTTSQHRQLPAAQAQPQTQSDAQQPPEQPPTPVTTYLDALTPISGNPERGTWSINGKIYPHSIGTGICFGEREHTVEYNLGKTYRTFKATIGLRDDTETGTRVRFQVLRDGVPYLSRDLGLGQSTPIVVPVQGVLRLRLVATLLNDKGQCGPSSAWGEARLEGLSTEVPSS